jgi:hypothetical protein
MTKTFGEVKLVYFKGEDKEPEHNFEVYADKLLIGYLHDCDGIGGYVWDEEFMDCNDFELVCDAAEEELKIYKSLSS